MTLSITIVASGDQAASAQSVDPSVYAAAFAAAGGTVSGSPGLSTAMSADAFYNSLPESTEDTQMTLPPPATAGRAAIIDASNSS